MRPLPTRLVSTYAKIPHVELERTRYMCTDAPCQDMICETRAEGEEEEEEMVEMTAALKLKRADRGSRPPAGRHVPNQADSGSGMRNQQGN
jgi:hypothetical protein